MGNFISIPKLSGGSRTIDVPTDEERLFASSSLPLLHSIVEGLDVHHVDHGFRRGRSAVTGARRHVGRKWTVIVSVRDFLESCNTDRLEIKLLARVYPKLLPRGQVLPGLPSSQLIASIAAAAMDRDIVNSLPTGCVYTRYAGELVVSGDDASDCQAALDVLLTVPTWHKYVVSRDMAQVQNASDGARRIYGVDVGDTGIRVVRDFCDRYDLRSPRYLYLKPDLPPLHRAISAAEIIHRRNPCYTWQRAIETASCFVCGGIATRPEHIAAIACIARSIVTGKWGWSVVVYQEIEQLFGCSTVAAYNFISRNMMSWPRKLGNLRKLPIVGSADLVDRIITISECVAESTVQRFRPLVAGSSASSTATIC